jgi:hypothetical protein
MALLRPNRSRGSRLTQTLDSLAYGLFDLLQLSHLSLKDHTVTSDDPLRQHQRVPVFNSRDNGNQIDATVNIY